MRKCLPSSQVGVFRNCFGDANALVRRTTFEALGGFTEDSGVGHEDWELWVRAVLRGYHILVVPEPLYWYRVLASGGMLAESLGSARLRERSSAPTMRATFAPIYNG